MKKKLVSVIWSECNMHLIKNAEIYSIILKYKNAFIYKGPNNLKHPGKNDCLFYKVGVKFKPFGEKIFFIKIIRVRKLKDILKMFEYFKYMYPLK